MERSCSVTHWEKAYYSLDCFCQKSGTNSRKKRYRPKPLNRIKALKGYRPKPLHPTKAKMIPLNFLVDLNHRAAQNPKAQSLEPESEG